MGAQDRKNSENENTTQRPITSEINTIPLSIQHYEKMLPKIAFASFTLGLASVFFYNRKGKRISFFRRQKDLSLMKAEIYDPHVKLATKFSSQPVEEARMFALKTFGLGTLLCTSVMGSLTLGVAYLTGCSSLKEFSQFMRLLIGKQILNKDLQDIPTYDQDEELSDLYEELEQDQSK